MLPHQIGTLIYRLCAEIAAKRLSSYEAVLGIYARRSLASGEVVFGRSDIDFSMLIADFDQEEQEASFMQDLCHTYSGAKRLLPMLGECNVFNDFDIRAWYAVNTYESYADRNWIRLYGSDIDPFPAKIREEDLIYKFIWWVFKFLFHTYRVRNIKGCFNVLMELANCYYTYTGIFAEPKAKKGDVLKYMIASEPSCKELLMLQRAFNSVFLVPKYPPLSKWIYKECLGLCEALYDHIPKKLEGEVKYMHMSSCSPPEFLPRQYIVAKSPIGSEVEDGLEAMKRDKQVVLVTDKLLNLYLYYYNPWEYYVLARVNGTFGLSEPPVEAMLGYILRSSNKMIPRYIGLVSDYYNSVYNLISQCRLYLDYGFISDSELQLREAYRARYSVWPYQQNNARDPYLEHDYPILLRVIDDIYESKAFS